MTLPPEELKPLIADADYFDFDTRENDEDEPLGWFDGDLLDTNGIPIFKNSLSDTLMNAEVLLPHGEELETSKLR